MSKKTAASKTEDRGPGARKTRLERHLDANADLARRSLAPRKRTVATPTVKPGGSSG